MRPGIRRPGAMALRVCAWMTLAALILCAQSVRQSYRDAYRVWHEADPSLERDAATAGPALGARADRVAAAAASYHVARHAFLDQFSQESARKLAWLAAAPPEALPAQTTAARDYLATEGNLLRKSIDAFAGDPDAGIQQVRGMLDRETAALNAVRNTMSQREQAASEADTAASAMRDAWRKAYDRDREWAAIYAKSAASVEKEAGAWTDYYRTFSDSARGVLPESSVTFPARSAEPVTVAPSITPLPLVRYTGDWIYPDTGRVFHGAEPAVVDLTVREKNGRCEGRMVARFKLPPGSPGDPILRFDFSGDFRNTRIQTFALQTPDGSTGTIDLIPGPAFNLLEINVQVAGKTATIHQANTVLVKK